MLKSLACLSFLLLPTSYGITVPLQRRDPAHSTTVGFTTSNASSSDFTFSNVQDVRYTVQIELGGHPYTVILDTGSTDLWVDRQGKSVPGLTDTGFNASIHYVTSAVEGPIAVGEVALGQFSIPQQAFIDARNSNITDLTEIQGLMGLSPPMNSDINHTLSTGKSPHSGIPFLDNVFSLYPKDPSILTFLLTRNDAGITSGGTFTIGEIVQDYAAISNTPQLPVLAPKEGAWVTLMDAMVVNGSKLSGHSLNNGQGVFIVPSGKVSVVLDTGTPFATAPPYYVDAIYKSVPGAVYDNTTQGYTVPCDTKVNITLVFGSNEYPINPIDSTWISDIADDGSPVCSSSFTYTPDDAGLDFLLGDSFLRNVYSLFDFGNWTSTGTTAPFMQILSVTDADQAHGAFDALNTARIQAYLQTVIVTLAGEIDGSNNSTTANAAAADAVVQGDLASSDGSSSSNSDDYNTLVRNSYIIMGIAIVAVLLLIGLVIASASQCRGNRKQGYRQVDLKESFSGPIDKPYSTEASYADYPNPYEK